ncbi:MAG: FkbM family methyltransferase [Alphaproteobacteria bacterium]|nr:FkbM family methyltransferase [Alphaproteobacteria bacterium]
MADGQITLKSVIPAIPLVRVVDVGANPVGDDPPYMGLIRSQVARVTGFEPNPEALCDLNRKKGDNETYLPHVIGDGTVRTFRQCSAPAMSSLLEPDQSVLSNFHLFPAWGRVVERIEVETKRLDDLTEIDLMDYLKIDVQGAELLIFENAVQKLKDCLVIHSEVEFLALYEDQPLFSEVELFLRKQGFILHRFAPLCSRVVQPMLLNNDPHAGFSQLVWADAVFIRNFMKLEGLSSDQLLKFALILHDAYGAFDIMLRVLLEHDRRFKTDYCQDWYRHRSGG